MYFIKNLEGLQYFITICILKRKLVVTLSKIFKSMVTSYSKDSQETLNQLGKRLKTIRLKKGLRQREVAERCGFNKSFYNVIEAGKRNITILTLHNIAYALGVPMEAFFRESALPVSPKERR